MNSLSAACVCGAAKPHMPRDCPYYSGRAFQSSAMVPGPVQVKGVERTGDRFPCGWDERDAKV